MSTKTYPEKYRGLGNHNGSGAFIPEQPVPEFPKTCPVCGAHPTPPAEQPDSEWARYHTPASYDCGGAYTLKPQIQNHTDKWWGRCGA